MLNYRKLLKFINRVIYISSAALLIAGSAMNVMAPPAPVEACNAQPVTICHGTGLAQIHIRSTQLMITPSSSKTEEGNCYYNRAR